jgi:hypothetical protein
MPIVLHEMAENSLELQQGCNFCNSKYSRVGIWVRAISKLARQFVPVPPVLKKAGS